MMDMRENQLSDNIHETGGSADMLKNELAREINRLHRFSIRGIQALSLFLVVSMLAWWGFGFLPTAETVVSYLGKPPSARMISVVLLLYTFFSIILSLSRMTSGIEHRSSFCHVGYLTVFFLFYYFGKSLQENYWAVFGAGITILGIESYRIWTYCAENISRKQEDLEFVVRTGRPPPQEL
jgi:hypothetical protein